MSGVNWLQPIDLETLAMAMFANLFNPAQQSGGGALAARDGCLVGHRRGALWLSQVPRSSRSRQQACLP